MTLFEMLGILGALIGVIFGIVIGVMLDISWWTIGMVIAGLIIGWLSGVGLAYSPFMDKALKESVEKEE